MFRSPASPVSLAIFMVIALGLGGCGLKATDTVPYLNRVMKPLGWNAGGVKEERATAEALRLNATYYFLLGQELSAKGRTDEAIVAYERVRSLDADAAYVHYALAQEYLKKGLTKEGVAMVRKAIELEPKHREARLLLASLQVTAKKYDEATRIFEQLSNDEPDNEEILLNLALIDLEQRSFDRAHKRLSGFLNRNPDSALAYFYIGRLEQERGRKQDALKAYAKAIDLKAGFVQAGTYMGFLMEELGDRKGAIETFAWLANQTDGARYHKKLGQLYLDANDYAHSLEAFLNYERVDPQDLNNKVKVGLLRLENRQPELAEKKFREVLKESPDSENVRFYLASVYEEMKKHSQALAEYEKIPPTSKLSSESFKRRALILHKQGKTEEGWKVLRDALATAGDEEGRYEELVDLSSGFLSHAKRYPDARKLLNEAIAKLPDSERLLYARAVLLEKMDGSDVAVSAMQELLRKNPDHAAALNFVGFLWADKNLRLPEAEAMIRRALKSRPKDPFILDSLGWVLYRRGRFDEALRYLREAFQGAPEESVIAEHIGDVLVKMGRLAEAKTNYEKALQLGPEKDSDKQSLEAKLNRLAKDLEGRCRNRPACVGAHGLRESRSPASSGQN